MNNLVSRFKKKIPRPGVKALKKAETLYKKSYLTFEVGFIQYWQTRTQNNIMCSFAMFVLTPYLKKQQSIINIRTLLHLSSNNLLTL